jgi:hypothetical protein
MLFTNRQELSLALHTEMALPSYTADHRDLVRRYRPGKRRRLMYCASRSRGLAISLNGRPLGSRCSREDDGYCPRIGVGEGLGDGWFVSEDQS